MREERRDRERQLKEERKQREREESLAAQRNWEDRDRVERREREDQETQEKQALAELEAELEHTRHVVELEAAEKLAVLEKERREVEALRKKNERLLRNLHPIKEKEDLEVYLNGMEHILRQCQVDEDEWLFYLMAKMSGRYAPLVQGLTIDDDEEYEAVKGRMLEAAGLTTIDAGQQLFQLNSADTRGKTALEVFQLVTRLIKRIYKGAVTVHDYLLAIAVPVLRKMLPKEGVAFLDQKCPKSMEAMLDSLQQWWAITRGRTSEDIYSRSQNRLPFHLGGLAL